MGKLRSFVVASMFAAGCTGGLGPEGPEGPQGAQGSQGDPGMDLMFNGQPAGGALAGTYPAPDIAPGAIAPHHFGSLPAAEIDTGGDQAIPNATVTKLTFAGVTYDTGNMFNAANPTRITVPIAGIYNVTAAVKWRAGAGQHRFATIRKNGVAHDEAISQVAPVLASGQFTSQVVAGQLKLAAGDFLELFVFQDSGASLNTVNGLTTQVVWMNPGV